MLFTNIKKRHLLLQICDKYFAFINTKFLTHNAIKTSYDLHLIVRPVPDLDLLFGVKLLKLRLDVGGVRQRPAVVALNDDVGVSVVLCVRKITFYTNGLLEPV